MEEQLTKDSGDPGSNFGLVRCIFFPPLTLCAVDQPLELKDENARLGIKILGWCIHFKEVGMRRSDGFDQQSPDTGSSVGRALDKRFRGIAFETRSGPLHFLFSY